jgi:hypothetical protein
LREIPRRPDFATQTGGKQQYWAGQENGLELDFGRTELFPGGPWMTAATSTLDSKIVLTRF